MPDDNYVVVMQPRTNRQARVTLKSGLTLEAALKFTQDFVKSRHGRTYPGRGGRGGTFNNENGERYIVLIKRRRNSSVQDMN